MNIGTKIHYTGDTANNSGDGEITSILPCEWYGSRITVKLNDGRIFKIAPAQVGPLAPGNATHRFQVLA
jgi:hypothetical protein